MRAPKPRTEAAKFHSRNPSKLLKRPIAPISAITIGEANASGRIIGSDTAINAAPPITSTPPVTGNAPCRRPAKSARADERDRAACDDAPVDAATLQPGAEQDDEDRLRRDQQAHVARRYRAARRTIGAAGP